MEEVNATQAQLATMTCRVICKDSLKWVCCVGLQLPLMVVSSARLSRKRSLLELRFFIPSGAAIFVYSTSKWSTQHGFGVRVAMRSFSAHLRTLACRVWAEGCTMLKQMPLGRLPLWRLPLWGLPLGRLPLGR